LVHSCKFIYFSFYFWSVKMLKKIIFLAIVICLAGSAYAGSQTYSNWQGPEGGDWNTAGNWTAGVPLTLDPLGGPQASPYFGKAGFKGPIATSPGITGTVSSDQIVIGGAVTGILTIGTGGTVNISEFVNMGNLSTELGVLNMNGGTLNCGVMIPSTGHLNVGYAGNSTLNMNSGTINLTSYLSIADQTGSTGYVHLNGGTINATSLLMDYNAHLDISGGTLVLDGNNLPAITGFIGSGKITAYNGTGTILKDYNITNSGKTTVRGYLANPKAANPNPGNGSSNVSVSPTLNWTAGDGATSHDVYFGTVSPGTSQGNQTAATFNPGTLSYGTTYYWRIDEVSNSGTTTGDVWSFTTTSGQASSPSPINGAVNVSTNPTLSWTAGLGITSHNVYFGTASPGTLQGNQSATTFSPPTLPPNVTYYWRIDEVAGSTVITGPVWSFTTAQLKATSPNPANSATGIFLNATLSWTTGAGAASHDVYFGTASPGTFRGNQPGTSFNPGILTANTTYYWRIDEKDGSNNTTTGDAWQFATGTPPEVYPYLSWRHDPNNSMVVNWFNPIQTGDSSVDYGLTSSYGSTVNVPTATNYHHVELTNLTPGTTYHYRIRSTDGTFGSDNSFTTAPAVINSFSFAVYGDPRGLQSQNNPFYTLHGALCDWINANGYNFAIETGDTVWGGCASVALPLAAQGYYTDFYKIERNLAGSKPIMATMGNHEVQTPDSQGVSTHIYYYDLYGNAYPTNGPPGNNGAAYSFNYGNAHFVCLSSFKLDRAAEGTWLDTDLAAARANPSIKWIFAYMHYPLYTDSGHKGDQEQIDELNYWRPKFDQYHVDMVFAGHNHCYERSYSLKGANGNVVEDGNGTVYITNGLGGASFDATGPGPWFVSTYGGTNATTVATCITINGDYLTCTSIKNATGQVLDTFQLNKVKVLAGDFNGDGTVDRKDLSIFAGSWLSTGIWP
jgi:hypothetical protein